MDLITTAAGVYPVPETAVVYPATAWMGTERGITAPVPLVQYDDRLPILAVALRLNGQPYTVPEGAAVNIRMDKRDGHYVYNPALGVSEDRQTAYIGVTLQMTTGAGEFWPTIEIVIDGQVAGTSYVPLLIAENPVPEDAIESTDEYKTIQQLAAEVTQAAQTLTDNLPAINAIGENIDNINSVAQNGANISAVGGSIANVNSVAENLTPIQTAATNISAIQQAPQQAENAAASATLSESWAVGGTGTRDGEDTNNAKYYAEQAQQVSQGAVGWYETEQALQAAHPAGQNGQWAIIGTTDTIWTWDSDTNAWVNTGIQIDLSNYYQKQEANARFQMPIGYIFEWAPVGGQSVDLSTPEKVAQYFGYGTWVAFGGGKVLAAVNDSHAIGTSVGEESHAITVDEMPAHKHGLSAWQIGTTDYGGSTGLTTNAYPPTFDNFAPTTKTVGGGQPISLMQPTQYVYRWQRIA